MLTKTEAIVLKSMKYRDTSKIVTFYTREFGKIKCIAKGARSNKSKFGASLEPLTHVALLLYKKEHTDLHLLSQADIIHPFKRIHSELDRMAVGMSVLELLNQVTHQEERNERLFSLVDSVLDACETAEGNLASLISAFEMRLADIFGYTPQVDRCSDCGIGVDQFRNQPAAFLISHGSLLCGRCVEARGIHSALDRSKEVGSRMASFTRLSPEALREFKSLLSADLSDIASNKISDEARNEIDETLRLYLRYHFEEIKPLKSAQIFKQLSR